jgi:dolichol-phosphate mannosyltransferase
MDEPHPRPPLTRSKVWLVLPALNEENSLPPLLARIEEAMFEADLDYRIVFVDDGSTDGTAQIMANAADRLDATTVTHDTNLGLGAAIRDGLLEAARQAEPRDIIVTLDSDNTHTPDLILRMVRLVREGHDVVIASRYRPGSRIRGVPMLRRILSRVASMLLRVVFPTPGIRDYTSGFRAYRAEVMQQVVKNTGPSFFDQDGFQVMIDILLKLRRRGDLIFGEVPLILRYDLKADASKMDVSATIVNTLKLVGRRRVGK